MKIDDAAPASQWALIMPLETSWPFKTPEGQCGWRYLGPKGELFELIFLQPPYRGSEPAG